MSVFLLYEIACITSRQFGDPTLWLSKRSCFCVLGLSTVMRNVEINVLSAGAVQPGIVKIMELFRNVSHHRVKITFATAPIILQRIEAADGLDVIIAPPVVLDEWVRAGKASAADRVTIGRIGVGVMVRHNTPPPKIATVDNFKKALLSAASVVYNQASTGIYLEKLFERLAIAEQLESKTVRYPDAAAVLDHISKGQGVEIGLGATTVIMEGVHKGLKFVGPLPLEIQNYTTYIAAMVNTGSASYGARDFVRYLTGPAAKKAFVAAGIQ
jgi:molybdate transport system substrate-binding protein